MDFQHANRALDGSGGERRPSEEICKRSNCMSEKGEGRAVRARLKGWRRYAAKPLSARLFRRRRFNRSGAIMRRLRHAKIPVGDRFGGDCFSIGDETCSDASNSENPPNVLARVSDVLSPRRRKPRSPVLNACNGTPTVAENNRLFCAPRSLNN